MILLDRISRFLNRVLVAIAGVFLAGMILMICANILMRIFWAPVRGSFELMGFFGAVVTAFALGYTQTRKGHVSVDVLMNRFPPGTRRVLNMFNTALCTVFFGAAAWQLARWSTNLLKTGEVTETLRIVYYPFSYAVSLGLVILSMVFFTELLKSLFPPKEDAN